MNNQESSRLRIRKEWIHQKSKGEWIDNERKRDEPVNNDIKFRRARSFIFLSIVSISLFGIEASHGQQKLEFK